MRCTVNISVRPSTSLRYAQDERFSCPFVLSVTRRVESKHEQRSPQMISENYIPQAPGYCRGRQQWQASLFLSELPDDRRPFLVAIVLLSASQTVLATPSLRQHPLYRPPQHLSAYLPEKSTRSPSLAPQQFPLFLVTQGLETAQE